MYLLFFSELLNIPAENESNLREKKPIDVNNTSMTFMTFLFALLESLVRVIEAVNDSQNILENSTK